MADRLPPAQRAALMTREHDVSHFDCGKKPLNDFMQNYALQNQSGGSARTYVALREERIVAYYSLGPGAVTVEQAPIRVSKGQPRHPIPIILMARIAVEQAEQGKGLGKALLHDALERALEGAEVIGGRAFMVNAKDEDARAFYLKFGMEPSPSDALMLFTLFKDIRQSFGR